MSRHCLASTAYYASELADRKADERCVWQSSRSARCGLSVDRGGGARTSDEDCTDAVLRAKKERAGVGGITGGQINDGEVGGFSGRQAADLGFETERTCAIPCPQPQQAGGIELGSMPPQEQQLVPQ